LEQAEIAKRDPGNKQEQESIAEETADHTSQSRDREQLRIEFFFRETTRQDYDAVGKDEEQRQVGCRMDEAAGRQRRKGGSGRFERCGRKSSRYRDHECKKT